VIVEVLDQSGKVSRVTRSILLQPQVAASQAPVRLTLDSPAQGARVENGPVVITGSTDAASVTINGVQAPITVPGGRFEGRFTTPAGAQTFTVVARSASGATATETRTVTVAYTAAVILVQIKGGDAWVQATVDGTLAPGTGRVFKDGEASTYTGRQVVIRTGNAAATLITHNGTNEGAMGQQGQVVEKVYTAQ